MSDPYLDGVYRWWNLTGPSPELLAAQADGWLTGSARTPGSARGLVIDVGCGLGSELAHLARAGWRTVGVDLSAAALRQARASTTGPAFARADVRTLPFAGGSFDLALDRGCFHYLPPSQWRCYAAELARVLQPGGRLLLRTCLTSAGVRNQVTESGVVEAFAGWQSDGVTEVRLVSDTRSMPALVARLRRL